MKTPKSFVPDSAETSEAKTPKSFVPDQQPEKGNSVLSTILRVLNIPSDMLGGSMKASREALKGEFKTPEVGPTFKLGKDEQFNLGKLLHPTLVGAARGLKDQTPIMQELPNSLGINPDSPVGMGVGLAGEIATPDPLDFIKFGKVAEKITGKLGRKVAESGEELVLKGLKPSPSQQKKFLEKTGEQLSGWMSKNNISSNFVEEAGKKIEEVQGQFDEIALSKNIQVNPNKLLEKFIKTSEDIKDTVAGDISGKAKKIEDFFDSLTTKYGDKMTAADLTKERKGIDDQLKESQFGMPLEQASYLRSVRNAITEAIQDSAGSIKAGGKSLKELGSELNKLYSFEEIANKQSGLGKGNMAFGITDLIAGGAGFASGDDPVEKLKNAVLGVVTKRMINSPKVVGKTSEALQKTGSMLQSPSTQKTLESLLRVAKEMGIQLPR